ncbi:hypothetical protein M427DRAFT_51651 [Gonapodya prolifera JEL478]|uniref:Uncharacterized protein n=1 Tax=Gonapodya prolifera (strain JEL478) TaxID=1344416 RepID=A0A139AXI4_GONPJ|nr:hypothetical protein M427DRAFT_51651 [Gonapodya prolifera JEL478]|eukprot:KXS21430.1 hypothetical protein M427DRAFT_51651 [Gonapodya prolifera JEL478]
MDLLLATNPFEPSLCHRIFPRTSALTTTIKRFPPNVVYHNFDEIGLSLALSSSKTDDTLTLDEIHLMLRPEGTKPGFKSQYSSAPLPHLGERADEATGKDIVELLGEPERKGGGRITEVWFEYQKLGLQIVLATKVWDDGANAKIRELIYFKP